MRPRLLAAVVVAGGASLIVATEVLPTLRFAYDNQSVHVVVDTAALLVGALVAYLAFGRYRRGRRRVDLLVASGLGLLVLGNVGLLALAALPVDGRSGNPSTWTLLAFQGIGAGLLTTAALSDRPSRHEGRRPAWVVPSVGQVGLLVLVGVIASGQLSVDRAPSLSSSETIHISASVAASTALGLVVVLFAVAAWGFLRRSDRENDEFIGWMGAGCALAALASLSYMLFPPLNQSWFYTADLLRLGAYLMWLIGGAREIAGYWSELAQVAVTEERRRLARDLHDGMAQELAFVTTQAASAARGRTDPTAMTQLGAAAQRALDESRRAIAALATDHDDPLQTVLVNVTEEVAGRYGSKVRVDIDDSLVLPPKVREGLLWIVREAVTNAARHGKAREVTVEVRGGKPVSVCVRDNGCGFSPEKVSRRRGGFGLISMRERAEAIGAEVMVSSTPFGTTVKIG